MEHLNGASIGEALSSNGSLYIMRHSPYQNYTKSSSLPWFDLKVFYVQINNFHVDAKTPDSLLVTHIPLNPDTLLEFNGCRMKNSCNGVNSILRRDRVDKKSEEATFVSTDTIRLTGSVKFEVFNEEDLVLSGVLEMSNSNGFTTESKNSVKRWSMTCEQGSGSGLVFNKGDSPTIEVYVAGSFAGSPIILTKSLQICSRKKNNKVSLLCAIPENEATEGLKGEKHGFNLQGNDFYNNKTEHVEEEGYEEQMYWRRPEYLEGGEELDGELSWFNAGVRVGVGIGLGICVSVGVGVGLLVQSYQATTRNFRRRRLV